jgi:hypothetical protein
MKRGRGWVGAREREEGKKGGREGERGIEREVMRGMRQHHISNGGIDRETGTNRPTTRKNQPQREANPENDRGHNHNG